ncbi:MAG TPA: hypothetical protein VG755_01320 [Nannocystaceae bacterium]|nr:hypothetical protein [Nannocystaceae bacterium]
MSRRCWTIVLGLLLASCRRDGEPTKHADPQRTVRPSGDAMAKRLAALADEIDTGEQKPLRDGAPPVVEELIGPVDAVDASALEAPLEAWETLGATAGTTEKAAAILALARTLLVCESARVKDRHDRVVRLRAQERLYSFFDLPMFANDRSLFPVFFGQIGKLAVSGKDANADQARAMQLVDFAFGAIRRAGPLHRHTAAVLMREFPEDRHIPDVLDRVADAVDDERPELAVRLRKTGVEIRGGYVTAAQLIGLARACYVAFDERCGDDALAQGKAKAGGDAELAKRITAAESMRAYAKTAVANEKATTLEPKLARAEALLELGRAADADQAHAQLLAEYPDDARVIAAAAREIMSLRFDLEGAYQVIARAPAQLNNRDKVYYEIAIALRAVHLAYEVVPRIQGNAADIFTAIAPEYAILRADVLALERSDAARGKVLKLLLEIGEGAVPLASDEERLLGYARSLAPRGLALLDAAKNDADAWQVAVALAMLSHDEATVLKIADRPVPKDDTGTLALMHARFQMSIAVAWGERQRLAIAQRELDALPASVSSDQHQRVFADFDAIRWRIEHDKVARDRGIALYEGLVAAEPDARMLDNLAALKADIGDLKEAERLWRLVVEKKPDESELAQLHLDALAGNVAGLETTAKKGSNEARVLAGMWLVHLAKTPAERKRRLAQQRKTLAELHAKTPKVPLLPDAEGITLVGTLQVGVGYTTKTGMKLTIDVSRLPRLVRLPP